jgi:hypothetical protein
VNLWSLWALSCEPQRGDGIKPGVRAQRRPRVGDTQNVISPEGATARKRGANPVRAGEVYVYGQPGEIVAIPPY